MSQSNDYVDQHQHGCLKTYLIGFVLSAILTLIPFLMVMNHTASKTVLFGVIVAAALFQLVVQLMCFLHLGTAPDERWNLVSFIFTVIVIVLLVGLSIWIMWSLNANMVMG